MYITSRAKIPVIDNDDDDNDLQVGLDTVDSASVPVRPAAGDSAVKMPSCLAAAGVATATATGGRLLMVADANNRSSCSSCGSMSFTPHCTAPVEPDAAARAPHRTAPQYNAAHNTATQRDATHSV